MNLKVIGSHGFGEAGATAGLQNGTLSLKTAEPSLPADYAFQNGDPLSSPALFSVYGKLFTDTINGHEVSEDFLLTTSVIGVNDRILLDVVPVPEPLAGVGACSLLLLFAFVRRCRSRTGTSRSGPGSGASGQRD